MRHAHLWTARPAELHAPSSHVRDPFADASTSGRRGVIGTAAAIAIGLGTAGASAASNIYSSKRAGDANEKALAAQEREAQAAAQLDRDERASRERAYTAALEADRQRWNDYVRIQEPHWRTGSQALGSLYDLAGFTGGAPAMPTPAYRPPGPIQPGPVDRQPLTATAGAPPLRAPMTRQGARQRYIQPPAQMPQGGTLSLYDLASMAEMGQRAQPRPPTPYPGVPPMLARG